MALAVPPMLPEDHPAMPAHDCPACGKSLEALPAQPCEGWWLIECAACHTVVPVYWHAVWGWCLYAWPETGDTSDEPTLVRARG